jgi:hypothetical protein
MRRRRPTNTDVSSFIGTGCGYDAWTGSARRVVHDIFPVATSLADGGLKLDRTYSSHNDALHIPPDYIYYAPGERHGVFQLSYTWWMAGRDGINTSTDLYVVHFPDGRSAGFHSAANSGIPGETAWRSGLGTKERLVFNDPNGKGAYTSGTADLYLEDGTIVHFSRYTDFIEWTPPPHSARPPNFLFDIFTPTGVTDPHGLLTTFTMEQIPGKYEMWETRLKQVTDPSGAFLQFSYGSDFVNAAITQVTASDGQWVTYSPNATYSDGTSAIYNFDSITTTDPDTGDPGDPVEVLSSA